MEFLLKLDTWLFYLGNRTFQNPFFDWLMPIITEKYNWFPVWGLLVALLLWRGGSQGRIIVLLVIPIIFLSDQLSAQVIKPLVARQRPCMVLPDVHLLTNARTSFSFPSAHAANFFAVASLLSYFYKRYRWWFYATAATVAYSRIYIGIHYPFDALGGALLGIICTCLVLASWHYGHNKIKQYKCTRDNT